MKSVMVWRNKMSGILLGFLLLLAMGLSGCITGPGGNQAGGADQGMLPPTSDGSSDLLHPGDALVINFSGVTDPPAGQQDRIREDGKITLPYIGDVQAAGKTRSELQKEITAGYVPQYFTRLNVTVNADIRYIYVSGEVKIESRHVYMGGMTVLRAIATAGGFTDFANIKRVQLLRAGARTPVEINCDKARQHSELDLAVYPDDKIFVPRRVF
jgi:polysaccharide biosynthesis/export protein VpsN